MHLRSYSGTQRQAVTVAYLPVSSVQQEHPPSRTCLLHWVLLNLLKCVSFQEYSSGKSSYFNVGQQPTTFRSISVKFLLRNQEDDHSPRISLGCQLWAEEAGLQETG